VTETSWLQPESPDSLFCPNGYDVVRFDRPTVGGGVALFINNTVKYNVVSVNKDFHHLELVCVDLDLCGISYRIIGYYRNGGFTTSAIEYMDAGVCCFQKLCSTAKIVMILGDFNLPDCDRNFYHAPDNVVYNGFLKFINSYGFSQYVTEPTHDDHILDLILSTDSSSVCDTSTIPPISTSDHNVTIFRLSNNNASEGTDPDSHFYYNWSKANFTGLTKHLLAIDWNNIFQYCFSVDQCWDAFIDIIHKGIVMYVPIVLYKNKATPKNIIIHGLLIG